MPEAGTFEIDTKSMPCQNIVSKKVGRKYNNITNNQGGRQEFEIGVAYYKVGQKYPNKDIFEASGQKTR